MYDVRQFKPVLYAVVLLGMLGFAIASESYGLFVFAAATTALNAWLVRTGRFTPLPRLAANAVTLIAVVPVAMQFASSRETPILLIGQFLVLMQLIKLYEQRENRDYLQLLVLSLLLMVAGAVSSARLLFGVAFIAHLLLALYCCLLFQLKAAADGAKAALKLPEEKFNPETLRQDQRFLPRSMRRLTWITSGVGIVTAVMVFVLFPRAADSSPMVPSPAAPAKALTGFSGQVSFQQVARITQNNDVVAHVELWHNGEPVQGTEPLLLRGSVLESYSGSEGGRGEAWTWSRFEYTRISYDSVEPDRDYELRPPFSQERWRQVVQVMQPTGTNVLFAMPGAFVFKPDREVRFYFDRRQSLMLCPDAPTRPLKYEVTSDGELPAMFRSAYRRPPRKPDPLIGQYARGIDGVEDLVEQRGDSRWPSDVDGQIAMLIETHLHREFHYTLDLTDVRDFGERDPMVAFLYDFKRGHCEYFAGAMTLLCQSLGLHARMVVGFKCDEYNAMGGYYVVRQSHAHAWVEVLTPEGWKTFDPTTGNSAGMTERMDVGTMGKIRHLFNFIEHVWARQVVSYDAESYQTVMSSMELAITRSALAVSELFERLRIWWGRGGAFIVQSRLVAALLGLMLIVAFAATAWFLWERWKLWLRARRIGLESLPASQRMRLSRQLAFYDELLRLLERHNLVRAEHQTPLEFSNSLAFLPAGVHDRIRRLTLLFYKIRFGDRKLPAGAGARLGTVVAEVGQLLDRPSGNRS